MTPIITEVIVPGIELIRARKGVGRIANSYWLPEHGLLVEPTIGHPDHGAAWIVWLKSQAEKKNPVRTVLITHGHYDHVRGVYPIAFEADARLAGPRDTPNVTISLN